MFETSQGGLAQGKQPTTPVKLQRRSFTATVLIPQCKGPLLGALLPYTGAGLSWLCGSDQDPPSALCSPAHLSSTSNQQDFWTHFYPCVFNIFILALVFASLQSSFQNLLLSCSKKPFLSHLRMLQRQTQTESSPKASPSSCPSDPGLPRSTRPFSSELQRADKGWDQH